MIGGRLRQLRLARGLSLEELAARMGGIITKQALSKYETDKAQPTAVVLSKLAATLGVKAAYLMQEPTVEVVAYRRKKRLSKRKCQEIEGFTCEALEERVRLQKLCYGEVSFGVPVGGFPVAAFEDAEKAAERLREKWHLGRAPIASVVDTLEDQQIHVLEIEADEDFDGLSLRAFEEGRAIGAAVVCRRDLPGERQRLSLAHELGHLVMKVTGELDEEKAAFRFAGAFLAPRSTLLREVGSRRHNIDLSELLLLKKRFGMSAQALLRRFRDLDVITENTYKEWCIHFSRLGMRKTEPEPLPSEQGQWLTRTIYNGVAEGWLKSEEGERILGKRINVTEPTTLTERRAFMKLPLEERRRIMAKQVDSIAKAYEENPEWREFQEGDIIDYHP